MKTKKSVVNTCVHNTLSKMRKVLTIRSIQRYPPWAAGCLLQAPRKSPAHQTNRLPFPNLQPEPPVHLHPHSEVPRSPAPLLGSARPDTSCLLQGALIPQSLKRLTGCLGRRSIVPEPEAVYLFLSKKP